MCTHYFAVEVLQSPSHIHFHRRSFEKGERGWSARLAPCAVTIFTAKCARYGALRLYFCLLKITGVAPNDPASANIDSAPQKYTPPDYPAGGFNIITHPRNTIVQNNYQGSMENGYATDNYQDPHALDCCIVKKQIWIYAGATAKLESSSSSARATCSAEI